MRQTKKLKKTYCVKFILVFEVLLVFLVNIRLKPAVFNQG